jgi:membrane protein implicated in regulation of membrane protease activity
MIEDFFEQIGPWGWVLFGLALLVLEIFVSVPGSLFLFTGIAALIVGVTALLFDWAWQAQLIVFGILSIALVLAGRTFFSRRTKEETELSLNERAARLVGSSFMLVEAIVDGSGGRVKVGDSTWRAIGPDTPSGTRVKVVGYDGTTLRVEPEFPG